MSPSVNTTFSSLKSLASILYGQYVGSGQLLDGDTGNPSSLALILDLIHQRISGYPFEWDFLKVRTSFVLTGAATYDLSILFPDLLSVYQIYGINSNQESTPLPDYDANVFPFYDAYAISNGILRFTGNIPASGTVCYIQYKSSYMVRDVNGNAKRYFDSSDDYTVLKPSWDGVLTYGVGGFVEWMSDSKSKEQRDKIDVWFKEAWQNILLHSPQTSEVHNML